MIDLSDNIPHRIPDLFSDLVYDRSMKRDVSIYDLSIESSDLINDLSINRSSYF